jgi:AcrR family transcriptional regulator
MSTDRRVQRSRALLQQAQIDLMGERRYAEITVQDIVDRANVGRTTFYLHFTSKDDLFLSCHEAIISEFQSGAGQRHPFSRDELLSLDPSSPLVATYQQAIRNTRRRDLGAQRQNRGAQGLNSAVDLLRGGPASQREPQGSQC